MKKKRRDFLKTTGLAGLSLGMAGFKAPGLLGFENKDIKFISPIDGDMLNKYDGTVRGNNLVIKVKIVAPAGSRVQVNGVNASCIGGIFQSDVELQGFESVIEMSERRIGYKESIKVFWLKNYANKYRFSFDDNIWFLQDINNNANRYNSIFENPYLAILKKMHDTYGTKIHLNIYYKTEGFNLSQMTDKYKREWQANADWIKLSFHALADKPDRPYLNASYDEVKRDCTLVDEQIKRFAGEELMGPVTTLHWGEATVEGCRALRDSGYNVLTSYTMSYYFNEEQRNHINNRFIWRDNNEGIIFSKMAIVANSHKLEEIKPFLDNVKKTHEPRYIDLMIHEQYFYPHFRGYQPDFKEKIIASVKWAVDQGYEPSFLADSIF